MKTLILNRNQVESLVDHDELLNALAEGFKQLSHGEDVVIPPRSQLSVPGKGVMLSMPAYGRNQGISTKLVNIFPGNHERNLPSHVALITLMDAESGLPLAIMDGTGITAMRTAASSLLAAKLLARTDCKTMTILGAGVQGQQHLKFFAREFDFEKIWIGSRNLANAQSLAGHHADAEPTSSFEDAVRNSDIVCLCSDSAKPIVEANWLQPGQHISSVGYAPPGGELDPKIASLHSLFVESKVAFSKPPAGSSELQGLNADQATELGEILLGQREARKSENEITVYKSMGHAMEDLVVAALVHRKAKERGIGQMVEL